MTQTTFRIVCAAFACAVGATAHAQTGRPVDVGVGYSFVRFTEEDSINMPAGWLVSVGARTTDWMSIVGEVAGNYKSELGETFRLHTFQGGARIPVRRNRNVTPYGQFLLGAGHFSGLGGESRTKFSIEPGGGVDVPLRGRVAIRVGAGFPMFFFEDEIINSFRFHAGVVF